MDEIDIFIFLNFPLVLERLLSFLFLKETDSRSSFMFLSVFLFTVCLYVSLLTGLSTCFFLDRD